MSAPYRPITISIHIKEKDSKFSPYLMISIYKQAHPELLECNLSYDSRQLALDEASRMLCTIIEQNKGLEEIIDVQVVEENQFYSQYAPDGSLLN